MVITMQGLRTSFAGQGRRLFREARSTPGQLRLLSLVICGTAALLWNTNSRILDHTRDVSHVIGTADVPSIMISQQIIRGLTGAEASAANEFLGIGDDASSGMRRKYEQEIRTVGEQLEAAAGQTRYGSQTRQSMQILLTRLSVYTGLIETARANNRQGYPVGAAYLRNASKVMHEELIPAAQQLDKIYAAHLEQDYGKLKSSANQARRHVLYTAGLLLILLVFTQIVLARKTHRLLSVWLVASIILLVMFTIYVVGGLNSNKRQLYIAKEQAYDSVHPLSQVIAIAFDLRDNESLALIARGNGGIYEPAFNKLAAQLADQPITGAVLASADHGKADWHGLFADEVNNVTFFSDDPQKDEQGAMKAMLVTYRDYLVVHQQMRSLEAGGRHKDAVNLATATGAGTANEAFNRFHDALAHVLAINMDWFTTHIALAETVLDGREGASVLVSLLIALFGLLAVQPRINAVPK